MSVVNCANIGSAVGFHEIMYSNQRAMEQLVTAIIADQADATIDLMLDCQLDDDPDTEVTRTKVVKILTRVKESASEFIAEMIADLERSLNRALERAEVKTNVTTMEFNTAGVVENVNVNLYVNFKPMGD